MEEEIPEQPDEKQELVNHLQRLQAEFDNYRKRIQREQEENKHAANEKLLRELLPIIDNLHLAVLHAKDGDGNIKGEDLLSGVIMINDQLHQFLEHHGIESMQTENERFDPYKHEALTTVQQEGVEKGTILQTYQRGYTRGGRVFRPAKVSVAR